MPRLIIVMLFFASFIKVYYYTFLPLQFFRTGLIHLFHQRPFPNHILPFFYTSKFLKLYYYTYHSFLFFFFLFPPIVLGMYSYNFFPTFSGWFHRIVLLHFSTAPIFPYFPLDCCYSFTVLWFSFHIQLPYLLFSPLWLVFVITMHGSNWCVSSSSLIQQTWLW